MTDETRIKLQYENARHYFLRCLIERKPYEIMEKALETYRKASDAYFHRKMQPETTETRNLGISEGLLKKLREVGGL